MNPSSSTPSFLSAILIGLHLGLASSAQADQTVTGNLNVTSGFKTGTSQSPLGTELRLGGLILANGQFDGQPTLATGDQGGGTRLLWYPGKSAFRAGTVDFNEWNESNIGSYSFATGYGTIASGSCSVAMGSGSVAGGDYSVALGGGSSASGLVAVALGSSFAPGDYGTALGECTVAAGEDSVALGCYAIAGGHAATSIGMDSMSSGYASTALGWGAAATGFASSSLGSWTTAGAMWSTAVGSFNVGGGDPGYWVATDPIFEIGNGDPAAEAGRSNAVTVYKNGNMDVQGVVTCAPGGDIPMFGE